MKSLRLNVTIERFPIAGKFTISRGAKTEATVVVARIEEGILRGHGECVPYARYGETAEGVVAQIESVRRELEAGADHRQLQKLLPAGAARNAIDCALWDLEAKRTGVPAFRAAGLSALMPVVTAYTISLDTPDNMAAAAAKESARPLLKIKLGTPEGDAARLRAVRAAVPNAVLIADANEGWTAENLEQHFAVCAETRVAVIEQPLPAKLDEALRGRQRPVPVCADESVHDRASLDRLVGLYDVVNIKLDKTGGLTEALEMASAARARGFRLMIGCMVGSSLAMAPAVLLAQDAAFVDLDGPLLLAKDRDHGIKFEGSRLMPPDPELWG